MQIKNTETPRNCHCDCWGKNKKKMKKKKKRKKMKRKEKRRRDLKLGEQRLVIIKWGKRRLERNVKISSRIIFF